MQRISAWVQFGLLRRFQLLELILQESIIKTLISCDFTIWPPLGSWQIFFNTFLTPDCKRRVTQQYLTHLSLHWYKLNWPIPCDLPGSWSVLSGAFLFLSGIECTDPPLISLYLLCPHTSCFYDLRVIKMMFCSVLFCLV